MNAEWYTKSQEKQGGKWKDFPVSAPMRSSPFHEKYHSATKENLRKSTVLT
jgi:hypothetical protein